MADLKNEIDNINGHIKMLIDEDVLEKIGADIGDNRPLHLRVLRILEDYNNLQAENERLKSSLDHIATCLSILRNEKDIKEIPRLVGILEDYTEQVLQETQ